MYRFNVPIDYHNIIKLIGYVHNTEILCTNYILIRARHTIPPLLHPPTISEKLAKQNFLAI